MLGAHSTEGDGRRAAAWIGAVLLLALLAVAPLTAAFGKPAAMPAVGASSAHWMQIESRIESGYFQQDATGLRALAATLSGRDGAAESDGKDGDADAEWRSYYAALAAYRLALLSRSDEARAWPFAQRCVDRLNRTLVLDTVSAEALALQSACLALQSDLDPWRSPLAAPLSLARIDKALKLAPDNPRVLLLGALGARDRPRLFGGDGQRAFELMQRAVTAFERQSGAARGLPGWGAADAFTDLAQDYLSLGNALAARNVLERALLVAPQFEQARHLMAQIVSG
ncbi:MAG TPA: hypothetical protein VHE11_13685 [Steroidobacteraceae bacterium]|nr:hypothetical protein [Steroidobacteraceae bacterium]